MTEYKVDKGIPAPAKVTGGQWAWPILQKLEVGDSFFLPTLHEAQKLRSAVSQRQGRGDKRRYTIRRWEEGWRCWRTK